MRCLEYTPVEEHYRVFRDSKRRRVEDLEDVKDFEPSGGGNVGIWSGNLDVLSEAITNSFK